jgi:minor histocompatibility antigen H13
MPKPTAANLAAFALLALHASSLLTIPPLAANVVVTATAIVYLGCRKGLKLLPGARAKAAKGKSAAAPQETVTLSATEAWQFPLYGSLALCGMYALIKVLGKKVLNYILLAYFLGIGLVAVEQLLEAEASRFFKKAARSRKRRGRVVTLPRVLASLAEQTTVDLRLNALQQICWGITIILMVAYALTKHWLLNNLIAVALCIGGIESISIGSTKTAALLLALLFVYDITWVFGTDVMVTVAKGIDGPVKLLFRRSFDDAEKNFSMLGLGDVVVPGLFLALLLRFDVTQKRRGRPFFRSTLLAYALGLSLTLYVMFRFDAAQPALLYLVPACLGSAAFVGVCRGEFSQFVSYSEEEEPLSNGAASPRKPRAKSPKRAASPKRAKSPKRAASPRRSTRRIASQ